MAVKSSKDIADRAYRLRGRAEKKGGKALRANVENAYRRENKFLSPEVDEKYMGSYEGYLSNPDKFEKDYIRYLDPTGARFEEAGDSVAAANSRATQAQKFIQQYGENPSGYYFAGLLYQSAGELGKAKEALNKSIHIKNSVSSLPLDARRDAIAKIGELEGKIGAQEKRIERRRGLSLAASVIGLIGGVLFLSTNITGNAIADLTTQTISFLGAGLLIVSLIAGLFWIKFKKK